MKHALHAHEGKYQCNDKYPIFHQLTVISLNQSVRPPPPLPPPLPDDSRTTHYKKIQQQQELRNHQQQQKFWLSSSAAAAASSSPSSPYDDNIYRPEDVGRNGNIENWPVASSDNMPDIPPPRLPNNQYEDVDVDDEFSYSSSTAFSTTSTRYLPQNSYDTLHTSSTKQQHHNVNHNHHRPPPPTDDVDDDIENLFGYSRPRMTSPIIPQPPPTTTTTLPTTTTTTTQTTVTAYSSTTTSSATTVLLSLSPSQKGEH